MTRTFGIQHTDFGSLSLLEGFRACSCEPSGLTRPRRRNSVLDNWINDYVYMQRFVDWGVLSYTFHPFAIGRGHRMLVLEKLPKTLRDGSVEFCKMEAAATAHDKKFPLGQKSK